MITICYPVCSASAHLPARGETSCAHIREPHRLSLSLSAHRLSLSLSAHRLSLSLSAHRLSLSLSAHRLSLSLSATSMKPQSRSRCDFFARICGALWSIVADTPRCGVNRESSTISLKTFEMRSEDHLFLFWHTCVM